jgi:hypothetical protein
MHHGETRGRVIQFSASLIALPYLKVMPRVHDPLESYGLNKSPLT